MSDSRLDSFADRIREANILTADVLCQEALRLFWSIREDNIQPILVPLHGREYKIKMVGRGLIQHNIEFFFYPKALEWKIDKFAEQYLHPAMSWLSKGIEYGSFWADPSFELPQGVLDSAKHYLFGIELRCVISETKYGNSNVPSEWTTVKRWYNINTDQFEDDAHVAPVILFSVRKKIPLGSDG